ncbi:ectoine hydroxylase [Marinitenerispora sediminis]|uniref:Ectoine hydroxylase n=1 Tax=Marinitenerispora sediminis TaxID=1931232 RepID=A0A368T3J3_9ACTN|nr:ectoine hydroxylase [Marinitenerispora sediminis]RCV49633.1 ectoine hydroxylase [Marinitenerispora sediminis]RCV53117.1 ectoine hydroxylase [Marinitenerispora sediminis]RCV57162.1 ectoine hydroxylase [Marinitenerispora sediminis]
MTALTTDFEQPTTDEYPTRKSTEPALLYRREPVVWGGADGPIDPDTLASFDEKGYLQVEELLTPEELESCRAELRRLSEDQDLKRDERVVVERKSDEVRSIFEVHRISEVFADLVRDPRVVGRARQILGSDVYVHQSRVNYKPGFTGTDFYWHSDFETWHAEDGMPRMRAVSISIQLTDNYPYNGALMIMPGSHRTFVSCVGETPEDHYRASLKNQEVGTPDQSSLSILADKHGIDVLTGPAGGAIMFDSNCMHGSNGNITPFPRSNVFVVFNSVENTCGEPFAAPAPRPPFLGSRDFTPVV